MPSTGLEPIPVRVRYRHSTGPVQARGGKAISTFSGAARTMAVSVRGQYRNVHWVKSSESKASLKRDGGRSPSVEKPEHPGHTSYAVGWQLGRVQADWVLSAEKETKEKHVSI